MKHLGAIRLADTAVVGVTRVVCRAPRSGRGGVEYNGTPQVVLPRRGAFRVHRSRRSVLADPTTAGVFGAGEAYAASHPCDGGDACLAFRFRPDLHEEALGGVGPRAGRPAPRTQLAAHAFGTAVGRPGLDAPARDETALVVLDAIARDLALAPAVASGISARQRARAGDVRAMLAADLGRRWRLDEIARAVHCSPFHLAREFRRATRRTVTRHLLGLRLAAALDRLADGERDFGRMAADLGFAHHSHFTARFRAVFGCTPRRARAVLTASSPRDLRTIVRAPGGGMDEHRGR